MPPYHRVKDPGVDGPEDLRDQPEEPEVGGTVARGPTAVELRVLGFAEHVEAEPEVLLVGQAVHRGGVGVVRGGTRKHSFSTKSRTSSAHMRVEASGLG